MTLAEKIFAVYDKQRRSGGEFPWASLREWEAEAVALENSLREFIEYQISDYDRRADLARDYCDIRRRAIRVLGTRHPTDKPSGEPK